MELIGCVENIVFRNETNNYTVINISSDKKSYTLVGVMPDVSVGQTVEVVGELINNARFGEQVQVKEIKVVQPTTLFAIQKYLGSGLIRGVGPVTAEKIVCYFGKDTLSVIELAPMRLAEIKGISKNKAKEIATSYNELRLMQESIIFLQNYQISTNMALKIFDIYKNETIPLLKSNPYKLVEDVDGIGFLTADKIATKLGIDYKSEYRLRAGLMHTLKEASERDGHTYLPKDELIKSTLKLLSLGSEDVMLLEKTVEILGLENITKTLIHHNKEIVMLNKFYFTEKYISSKLNALNKNCYESKCDFAKSISHYEKINKITLNQEQKQAIISAMASGVSVITGGPGTGKTTIIRCLLELISQENKSVMLLAPTGRAAKRLSETSKIDASTIHRALEMTPNQNSIYFNKNERNPLTADIIIVDEVSMVDVSIFYYLLKAIKPSANLILVGDKDQLPSVSAGNVLKDIIDSKIITTSYLTQIYRQDEHSLIVSNAHLINNAQMPVFDNTSSDFFFENEQIAENAAQKIIDMVSVRLPSFCNVTHQKIQVLAPMKMGVCGIDNLNKKLQERLNPHKSGTQIVFDNYTFRTGDKVMQTTNNYDMVWQKVDEHGCSEKGAGVFNGDIGYITHITPGSNEAVIEFDDGRTSIYSRADMTQITHAYAITIHKSQGSEFDYVVIPLVAGAPIILTKNLIYTAVTRAKKMVVLVGTKQNLARMVKNTYTTHRYTMLKSFLQQENQF